LTGLSVWWVSPLSRLGLTRGSADHHEVVREMATDVAGIKEETKVAARGARDSADANIRARERT